MRKIVGYRLKIAPYRFVHSSFICLLATFTVLLTPANLFAVGFQPPEPISNRQKAHLNINFTGGGNSDTTNTCSSVSTPLDGNSNDEKAFRFFIGKGFSEKQAAGIIGNFMVESGVNPMRVQGAGTIESKTVPSSGGYGLAQWDDRKDDLKAYAISQKRPVYDLSLQLDFTMFELNGKEKAAYDAFKKTNSIQEATDVWREKYERPGNPAITERRTAANKAYGDFASAVTGSPAPVTPADPAASATATPTTSCAGNGSGDIVSVAQAELAKNVLEKPIGCDAGNRSVKGDCGPEVNKYTDSTLEYWCADFVSWVYKEAGSPFRGGSSGGWRIPSAEGVQAYMEKNGQFNDNKPSSPDPQPGDIYIINHGEHVGIVVKVEKGNLYTISGNTSTDNYSNGVGVGDAVYTNFKTDARITGYGGLR